MRHANSIHLTNNQSAGVCLTMGWLFLSIVAYAAITGRVPKISNRRFRQRAFDFIHGETYCISREEEPLNFWFTFAVYLALAVTFIFTGIHFLFKQP